MEKPEGQMGNCLQDVFDMPRALAAIPLETDRRQLESAAVAFLQYGQQVKRCAGGHQVLCILLLVSAQPCPIGGGQQASAGVEPGPKSCPGTSA